MASDLYFPSVSDLDGDVNQSPLPLLDPATLPKFQLQPQQPAPTGGLLGNAVTAGYYDLLNSYGNAASALGAGMGNVPAANSAAQYAQQQAQAGEQYRDQALETAPWNPGGSWWNLPRQIPYQIAKQIPNVAATLAGGAAGAGAGAAAGSLAGPAGTAIGGVVGGALGAFGATYPQSVGSIYGEALDKNGGKPDAEAAREAALYGVPHALLDTASAGVGAGMFGKAAVKAGEMTLKQAAKTVLADTAKEALVEGTTEGAQRLIELTQRPDMTPGQKANSFIENAFFGAIAGGGMGGIASSAGAAGNQVMRTLRQLPADQTSNDDIKAATAAVAPTQGDQQRAQQAQQEQVAPPAAPEPQIQGEVTTAPAEAPPAPEPVREYSPSRQFGMYSDEQLNEVLGAAQRQGNQGIADIVRQEQMARIADAERQAADDAVQQAELRKIDNDVARKDILNKAGFKPNERASMSKFDYLDDRVLADQVKAELDTGRPSRPVQKLASYLGLLDEQGKPQNLEARLEAAQMALADAPNEQDRVRASRHLETLSRQFDLQQRMAEREKPAEVPSDVKGSILDAAQTYISENQISRSKPFLDGVQQALDNGVEPVRGPKKEGFKFARDLMSQQPQAEAAAQPPAAQPVAESPAAPTLRPEAVELLNSIESVESPAVMMTPRNRKIFQDAGVYSKDSTPLEMIQQLRVIRDQANTGVTNGQSTNAAFGGNDVGNGRNVEGSAAGSAVEGSVSFAPGEGRQAQPVRQEGQVGSAVQGQVSPAVEGQPLRENGQQGVWTFGGQTKSVQVSPEVRELASGKKVRKIMDGKKSYYVPAEQVSVGGPSATTVGQMMDSTIPTPPPAVDTTAPEARPSASGSQEEPATSPRSAAFRSASAQAVVRAVEGTVKSVAGSLKDRATIMDMVRKGAFYAGSLDHLVEVWGDAVPEIRAFYNAVRLPQSMVQRAAATQMPIFNDIHSRPAGVRAALNEFMRITTENQINGLSKSWEEGNEHIINDSSLSAQEKTKRRDAWHKLQREQVRVLKGDKVAYAALQGVMDLNAGNMHEVNTIMLLKAMEGMAVPENVVVPSPHLDYQNMDDVMDTPESMRKFWEAEKKKVVDAAKKVIAHQASIYADPTRPADVRRRSKDNRTELEDWLKKIESMEAETQRYPYFHMARFGDHMSAFHFATKEGGGVNPAAVREVARQLNNAGLGITISPDTTQPYVYMRFESAQDRRKAEDIIVGLQQRGLITDVRSGPRDANAFDLGALSPAHQAILNKVVGGLSEDSEAFKDQDDPAVQAARAQVERELRALILDALPDSNVRKVLTSRKFVPGSAEDMIRGAAHRFEVNNLSVAQMIANPQILAALSTLRTRVDEATKNPKTWGTSRELLHTAYRELAIRYAQRGSLPQGNSTTEIIKALTFTGGMGFNVSSALLQGLSAVTLGLPQLASRKGVGFVRAARAYSHSIAPTAKILSAVLADTLEKDWTKLGDVLITPEILKRAGYSANSSEGKFVMHIVNTGVIELGTLARDLGHIVSDMRGGFVGKANMMLRWANGMNQYMEVASRLSTALASREVYSKDSHGDIYEFTHNNITNSLFDFSNANASRLFNRAANPVMRLATTFMSYPAMWMQKLVREFDRAFLTKLDPKDLERSKDLRSQARNFLSMHFGMMVALAGVSGLPFAGVLSSVLTHMLGDDDEPYDFEAKVKEYFALWFGESAADVIMHGAFRLTGTDPSARIGGQDIFPMSQYIADARNWKESTQALAGRGLGAPASMGMNVLDGIDKIFEGDIWHGMRLMLPRGIQNMMDAYDLATDGTYKDAKGNALPVTPDGLAVLRKAIGFKSNLEADWQRDRQINDRYEKQMQRITAPIINGFKSAITAGDGDKVQQYIERAREVQAKNPQINLLKQMINATKGDMKSSMRERATGLPRAVDLKDPRLLRTVSPVQ